MEEVSTLQIVLISGACCAPHLAQLDKELEGNVQQAIEQSGAKAEVRSVSLSALLSGGGSVTAPQQRQLLSLFQKYGAKLAPAVLIGDQVRFAGSVASVEQLKEAFAAAADGSS